MLCMLWNTTETGWLGSLLHLFGRGGLGGAEHGAEAEDAWLAMKVAQCMGAADPSLQMWALPGSCPFMSVQDSEAAWGSKHSCSMFPWESHEDNTQSPCSLWCTRHDDTPRRGATTWGPSAPSSRIWLGGWRRGAVWAFPVEGTTDNGAGSALPPSSSSGSSMKLSSWACVRCQVFFFYKNLSWPGWLLYLKLSQKNGVKYGSMKKYRPQSFWSTPIYLFEPTPIKIDQVSFV